MRATQNRPQTVGLGCLRWTSGAAELRKRGVRSSCKNTLPNSWCFLLDHSGQVVTRGELLQNSGPAPLFVDFDRQPHKAGGPHCGPPSEIRRKVRGTSKHSAAWISLFGPGGTTITRSGSGSFFGQPFRSSGHQELLREYETRLSLVFWTTEFAHHRTTAQRVLGSAALYSVILAAFTYTINSGYRPVTPDWQMAAIAAVRGPFWIPNLSGGRNDGWLST